MATVLEELHKILEQLPPDRQRRVLEFAQRLTHTDQSSEALSMPTTPLPPGTPGNALRNLHFLSSQEDVEAMERALEDCERISSYDYPHCRSSNSQKIWASQT